MAEGINRYSKLIETIFFKNYKKGMKEVRFEREDLISTAKELNPHSEDQKSKKYIFSTCLPRHLMTVT